MAKFLFTLTTNKMKKIILLLAICFANYRLHAGDLDSIVCSNGWVIKVGQNITIGNGTMADKSFAHIATAPNLLSTLPMHLGSAYAGLNLTVKRIVTIKLKGAKKVELVVGGGNVVNYRVQIEQAIESGEILPPIEYRKKVEPTVIIQNNTSVADELVKLKKLYDDGLLSKEEFEAQKKKLLEK